MGPPKYLRRLDVPPFLLKELGLTISELSLAKWASTGEGGPEITYFGRIPYYAEDTTLAWAKSRLSRQPGRLTSGGRKVA
jgi:hypothetical protein